jgi:hypothetical protein
VDVSTKWVSPDCRQTTAFKIRPGMCMVPPPAHEPLLNRLTPRRIASGVLRRAKRPLPARAV